MFTKPVIVATKWPYKMNESLASSRGGVKFQY